MLLATLTGGARRLLRSGLVATLACGFLTSAMGNTASAQGIVPGTGTKVTKVGDDFEDEKWQYVFNNPKASSNIDKEILVDVAFLLYLRLSLMQKPKQRHNKE